MDTIATNLGFIVSGTVIAVLFVVGLVALSMKDRLYGKSSVLMPIIFYTLSTIAFGAGLIYIIYGQILSTDPPTQILGVKAFIGAASVMVLIGFALVSHILQGQGMVNVQSFNFFASFLIFQFCLMTAIAVTINKIRSFD
jgi:hypothetical protein